MKQLIYAIVVSFAICLVLGPVLIPLLKKLAGQTIREEEPENHQKKAGTPIMGGFLFLTGTVISTFLFARNSLDFILPVVLAMLGFGFIGFLDDFIKGVMKRTLGLRAYQKLIGQFGIAVVFTVFAYQNPCIGSRITLPFTDAEFNLGIWYIPIMTLIIVYMVNSVNLTDGADGLAASVTLVYIATFTIIFYYSSNNAFQHGQTYYGFNLRNMMLFSGALTGACIGFLRFNKHPAQIFMGDTGALALGGAVAGMAVVYRSPFLLVMMGGAFVVESVSVMLQVASFRLRKKRIFLMTPIHYHFEKLGMKETKLVAFFTMGTVILCIIGLLSLR